MNADDEQAYREYVVARLDRLRRAAFLLCQDWHLADDLVSLTIDKLYRNWRRARASTWGPRSTRRARGAACCRGRSFVTRPRGQRAASVPPVRRALYA